MHYTETGLMLKDRIITDMKAAMINRDQERLDAIRLLRAAIQRREVDERIDLDDEGVQKVIKKELRAQALFGTNTVHTTVSWASTGGSPGKL